MPDVFRGFTNGNSSEIDYEILAVVWGFSRKFLR